MDKCREAFERQKHLTLYIANLVFDEKDNRYIPNEKLIRTFEEWEWKAFSNQAYGVNLAWWSYQDCYVEFEEKDKRIEELESRLKAVHALARMRSAVITADRWFTLKPHIQNAIKCLDKKEKALRGEHE